jgi:hypothetical protein
MAVGACLIDSDTVAFQRRVKQLRSEGKDWRQISKIARDEGFIADVSGKTAKVKKLDPIGLRTPVGNKYGPTQLAKARARAIQKQGLAEETRLSPGEVALREIARTQQSGRRAGNFHGNATDRRRSREALATEFGDGTYAPCVHCGTKLHVDDITRDKIIPGAEGGAYKHENLIPACYSCNSARGDRPLRKFWRRIRELAA